MDDFLTGTVFSVNDQVKVGNGATTCSTRGCVLLETSFGLLAFPRALFLPDCGRKLIPESALDKLGFSIIKPGDGTITVSDSVSSSLVMDGAMSNGLYQFNVITPNMV